MRTSVLCVKLLPLVVGCWLPCSTTNLKNIRKCILNARNYLLAQLSELYLYLKSLRFLHLFFSGKCARTEALGIHEHRNLSSSSTATATTTAFCFLYPSIRLFLFCFGRLVGVCLRLCVCVCVLSVSGLGNWCCCATTHFAGIGVETAAVLRAHTLPYSHPLFSRVKCMYTWSISTGFHRTHVTYERIQYTRWAYKTTTIELKAANEVQQIQRIVRRECRPLFVAISSIARFHYSYLTLTHAHHSFCVRRLAVVALLSLSVILACSFSHMMRA